MQILERKDVPAEKNEELRQEVNNLVEFLGIKMSFLSKEAGIHHSDFSQWMRNYKNFNHSNIRKIDEVLERYRR